MTSSTRKVRELLDEIDSLDSQLKRGDSAWLEGTDECAMAECDPSDQFLLGQQVAALWAEVFELVNAKVKS